MPYKIVKKNLSKMKADAIVNPANKKPVCTPGTEMELYQAAGAEKMLAARRSIGDLQIGHVAFTDVFELHAKYVIHVAVPVWKGGDEGELDSLRTCYRNIFWLAKELRCRNIAMPLLMSGTYRFPPHKAMDIAMEEINKFLKKDDMTISLVVIGMEEFWPPERLIAEIDEYLGFSDAEKELFRGKDIDSIAEKKTENFGECLFRLIDERHYTDVEVYKRANVNRRLMSRLRQEPEKHVTKGTAFALAIGLRLSLEKTKEFIALAGWAFSPNYKFDRIVQFFIANEKYDIMEINEALFAYTGKILGG